MPEEGCSIVYAGHQGRDRESSNPASSSGESGANLTHSRTSASPARHRLRRKPRRGSGATNNRGFDTLTPTEIEVPSVDRHHRVDEVDEPPPRKNYRRRRSPPFCRTGQFRWGSPDYISGERASLAPLFKPITEFVPDSPLEGGGFGPSVPR